ncbi:MAG: D-alanyl-D-alanine carboxypeptidase [Micromonosporaceae bacterium]|nr:D-alanyl-D-alanine carboxypeptidase [Micromonosporaceae bacterium]
MAGRFRIAAVASVIVAALASPSPAAAAPPAAAPAVPCPIAKVKPKPKPRPPSPPPTPSHDPAWRAIGGKALAADGLVIPDGAPAPPKRLTAKSWLVADLDSGAVLGGCGPHVHRPPASVQKLLLAATFLPELDPNQVVKVTRSDLDFEPGSSAVGLVPRGKYTVRTLWRGLLMNSGNDAANVLARLGGAEDRVPGAIRAMNAEARRLGAYQTRAVTPSGLDGPGQFTSAYDLALIARACFARDDFRRYAATERAKIPAQKPKYRGFQIQNDNRLLFEYEGALGGKTGFTDLARHTFVGAAERDGRRLVVTLLGAERRPSPTWQQGAALLDWGFALPADAAVGRLVEPGEVERAAASRAAGAGPSANGLAVAPGGTGELPWWGVAVVLAWIVLVAAVALLAVSRWRRPRRRT